MSSTAQQTVAKAAAPRAGDDLRAARERLRWPIALVAARLRIRQPHLAALEAGRIDLLPGPAYAVAFLRAYAAALGLDPDEMARRFKAEAAEVNRQPELRFLVPFPERGTPAGALILLGLVLAVGAYAGWYRLSGEGTLPAETVLPVPQRLAPLAQEAAPVTMPSPALASVLPAPPPGPGALDEAPPVALVSPTSAAAAPIPTVPSAPPARAAADQIEIQATADAWLEVRDANGSVLLSRTLHPGDSWTVPPQAGLELTTGNAGGTVLVLDGVASPVLGNPGAVRRNLPLDPDLIRAGKLAATAVRSVQPVSLRTSGQ